jgi:hypothetical protein
MTPLEILLLILVIVAIGGGWRYGPWRTPAVSWRCLTGGCGDDFACTAHADVCYARTWRGGADGA